MQPYFSIIIPSYNRASMLARSVEGILGQTFTKFEIIVVDDGSTDDTEARMAKVTDSRLRYVKTENKERSHARNVGLKLSKGIYVNYFDSDDVMYLTRLQQVYDFVQTKFEPPVVFTRYDFVDDEGAIVGNSQRYFSSFTKDLLFNNFLAANAVLLKREVALRYPFHEDRRIITAEDWELWLRIHAQFDFCEYPFSTFAIRQHEQRSLSTISATRVMERDEYFASMIGKNEILLEKYGKRAINLFKADRYTFIALVFVLEKDRVTAFRFLKRSFATSFLVITRKRFWAVLKKLL